MGWIFRRVEDQTFEISHVVSSSAGRCRCTCCVRETGGEGEGVGTDQWSCWERVVETRKEETVSILNLSALLSLGLGSNELDEIIVGHDE